MKFLKRYRWIIIGAGVAIVVVAFLAFRPDKLFVDDAVDESLSDAFVTETVATTSLPPVTPATSSAPDPGEPTTTSTTQAPTTTQPEPSDPTIVASGDFFGIDHSAEGTAAIYEQDGRYILRFEDDTDIQNGPDLYVWLLEDDDYQSGTPTEYIDLGKIKGNVGGQNYDLPPEYDPDLHQFVLIWCLRFATPFAGAPLL
ncbi:MAG: DM13 domain-containing protein [Actinomycetia bacterium]|nr:DM13 domain-containing protein [Actinomycetes bacterium]